VRDKRWRYLRYKIPCECGCGELIDNRDRWGTRRHYKNGHFFKGKSKTPSDRRCIKCGSDKTYSRIHNGYRNFHWRKHNGLWYCSKCDNKYFMNPITHKIHSPKRIVFKGKRLQLKHNPRTGQCTDCHRRIGEGIKRTAMHHIEYHEDDPLKDTVELCVGCHMHRHSKTSRL
jgi:hypothetical protein